MSRLLNIGGDANDASYRYKMPALMTKIEGRGNGIKTVIPNMVDVAKALHVDPAYATKFFGVELGAQSKYVVETERAVVNGAHNQQDMQKSLEKFIDIFILCIFTCIFKRRLGSCVLPFSFELSFFCKC